MKALILCLVMAFRVGMSDKIEFVPVVSPACTSFVLLPLNVIINDGSQEVGKLPFFQLRRKLVRASNHLKGNVIFNVEGHVFGTRSPVTRSNFQKSIDQLV